MEPAQNTWIISGTASRSWHYLGSTYVTAYQIVSLDKRRWIAILGYARVDVCLRYKYQYFQTQDTYETRKSRLLNQISNLKLIFTILALLTDIYS